MDLKKTALYPIHKSLNAKMVGFAGFEMPLKYISEKEEHLAVRQRAGIFDVSHMGEFHIVGKEAADFVQRISSNDVDKLVPGKVQYACLTNHNGGIVDDMLVYCLKENEYMLVVNAANIEKDWNWIRAQHSMDVNLEDISDAVSLIAVQGPGAIEILSKITTLDLASMASYTSASGNIANITKGAIFSATGYTGAGGFEIYVYNEYARRTWEAIVDAGAGTGLQPCGLGARDTLRLEMGYCLYGNDINEDTSPLEAGLGWITKPETGFIGSEKILQQKAAGIARKLVGFEMREKGIPRTGYPLYASDGNETGTATSGTMSPSLGIGIGMGYVEADQSKPGTALQVGIRDKKLRAEVVKLPFYKQ
jgi:aminomethyltransferase